MEADRDTGTGLSSTARSGRPAIDAEGLVRKFGDDVAVAGVGLKVSPGEILLRDAGPLPVEADRLANVFHNAFFSHR